MPMKGHHFISYSNVDMEIARRVCVALLAGSPSYVPWIDKVPDEQGIRDASRLLKNPLDE